MRDNLVMNILASWWSLRSSKAKAKLDPDEAVRSLTGRTEPDAVSLLIQMANREFGIVYRIEECAIKALGTTKSWRTLGYCLRRALTAKTKSIADARRGNRRTPSCVAHFQRMELL